MVDFEDYADAKVDLVSRLGLFCSYCERPIKTNLAVEHIQPKKGPFGRPDLRGRWENFLLGCVNCNSTKGDKEVVLLELMLPDRDNTFATYVYAEDGTLSVADSLPPSAARAAMATLRLVGLDKRTSAVTDSNGRLVAIDRREQRAQAWLVAHVSRDELLGEPESQALRRQIVRTAEATGFFSIWMSVFEGDIDMRIRLVKAFPGTEESGCFDLETASPVTPAPNPDQLAGGGKA
ncbi:MAG: HNH endonuclease [Planctomycetota bacterium]